MSRDPVHGRATKHHGRARAVTGSESRCPLVTNYNSNINYNTNYNSNINYNYNTNINSNCNISSIPIDIHSSNVSGRGIQGRGGKCAENTRTHRNDKIWPWLPRVLRFVSHNAAGRRGAHGRAPAVLLGAWVHLVSRFLSRDIAERHRGSLPARGRLPQGGSQGGAGAGGMAKAPRSMRGGASP